jgi:hypothetical protein
MGPSKLYRKKCFEDIGGKLDIRSISWDTLDDLKAQMKKWQTRSFVDIKFIHHKIMGSKQGNIVKAQMKNGKAFYFLGYHPLFMIVKSLYRNFVDKPYFTGSLAMLWGYLFSWLKHEQQIDDKEMIRFLRNQQMEILTFKNYFKKENNKKMGK